MTDPASIHRQALRRAARRSRQAGVGLVEVLVALAAVALAVVALLTLQLALTRSAASSRHLGEAVVLAQRLIEDARLGGGSTAAPAPPDGYTVRRDGDDGAAGVTISWRDPNGAESAYALRTQTRPLDAAGLARLGFGSQLRALWPDERHPVVPPDAVREDRHTSRWTAGAGGRTFRIDHDQGLVLARCEAADSPAPACEPTSGYLVSGYVRLATGAPGDWRLRTNRPFNLEPGGAGTPPQSLDCAATAVVVRQSTIDGTLVEATEREDPGTSAGTWVETYWRYTCVVGVPDDDGDPATAPPASGRLVPVPEPRPDGSTPGGWTVRRFGPESPDAVPSLTSVNFRIEPEATMSGS